MFVRETNINKKLDKIANTSNRSPYSNNEQNYCKLNFGPLSVSVDHFSKAAESLKTSL